MERPIHGIVAESQQARTRRFAALGFVALLHIALIWALAMGLAQDAVKMIEDIAVVDVKPQDLDKKPPPPPPELEKPPPPVVPPPEFNIAPDAIQPTIVTTTAPVAAPKITGAKPTRKGRDCNELYPAISQRLQEQGNVMISFTILASGGTSNIAVTQSSGYPRLDEAAVACAKRWTYTPASREGVAVDVPSKAIVKMQIR